MAKKKKEVVEQVSTNEVQEDIVDMMKEVSMQPEVETPTEIVEEEVIENEAPEEVAEEVVENEVPEEVETVVEEDLIEEVKETEEVISEPETDFVIDKIIEDVKKNNDCDCNPKPRMSYRQMMGYDWNGQNFDM